MKIFNLEDKACRKTVKFNLAEIGLPKGKLKITGPSYYEFTKEEVMLVFDIPGRAPALAEINISR